MITRILAIVLGVVLALSPLQVSPVWAIPVSSLQRSALAVSLAGSEPASANADADQMAQAIPPSAGSQSTSFVAAVVDRVGAAVVRIDTERTITRNPDLFSNDPFFDGSLAKGECRCSLTKNGCKGKVLASLWTKTVRF